MAMLKVHFLNVGKGNCVVIKFPSGRLTVVDIDNSRIDDDNDTLQDPIEFLDSHYPNESIFRFILTHPDMDHMSGLHELHTKRKLVNFWDTEHEKKVSLNQLSLGGYSKHDWLAYEKLRGGRRPDRSPIVAQQFTEKLLGRRWHNCTLAISEHDEVVQ